MSADINGINHFENRIWYRCIKVFYGIGWFFIILTTAVFFIWHKPAETLLIPESGFTCSNGIVYKWKNYSQGKPSSTFYSPQDKYFNLPDHFTALQACRLTDLNFDWRAASDNGYTDREIINYLLNKFIDNTYPYPVTYNYQSTGYFAPEGYVSPEKIQSDIKEIDNKRSKLVVKIESILKSRLDPPYKINWVIKKVTVGDWSKTLFKTFLFLIISSIILDTIKNIMIYISYGQRFSYLIIDILKKIHAF